MGNFIQLMIVFIVTMSNLDKFRREWERFPRIKTFMVGDILFYIVQLFVFGWILMSATRYNLHYSDYADMIVFISLYVFHPCFVGLIYKRDSSGVVKGFPIAMFWMRYWIVGAIPFILCYFAGKLFGEA